MKLEQQKKPHHYFCLAGVTKTHSYTPEIETVKQLDAESQTALLEFLRDNIRFEDEVCVAAWKDDEIEERWKKDAPDDLSRDLEFFRTDHSVLLTKALTRLYL